MGRKRVYETAADRQRAYQRRKRKSHQTPEKLQQIRRNNFKITYQSVLNTAVESNVLSIGDYQLVNEWLKGKTYSELAEQLGISKQAIGQKLTVIENRLKVEFS